MQPAILKKLSEENTPAYVLDVECLKKKVLKIRESLGEKGNVEICFAMKANPFLIGTLDGLVDKFEVCSPGELSICQRAAIAPEKIVLSGVNKGYYDTLAAMKYGVEIFTAESWKHLELIQRCAAETNRIVKLLIRLTSGNQFGVGKETVKEMLEKRETFPNLQFCGIHFYSGTQKNVDKLEKEITELYSFCQELASGYHVPIDRLEYGPGLAVDYWKNDDADAKLEKCVAALIGVDSNLNLTIELGRFIAAECGSYITKVVDVKNNNGQDYCIVDGGIHHVNYYGQVMGARIPPVKFCRWSHGEYLQDIEGDGNAKKDVCVCGSLCTTADVLIQKISVKDVKEGDIFVFERIGAYSVTEGIYLFLSRRMPKIYLLENDRLRLVRDAYETYEWNCAK